MIVDDKDDKAIYTASKFGNDISVYTEQSLSDSAPEKDKGSSLPSSQSRKWANLTQPKSMQIVKEAAYQRERRKPEKARLLKGGYSCKSANQLLKGVISDTATLLLC